MAHAKPEHLKNLQAALDEVRRWPRIKEKSANIFYLGAKPFLHFHTDGARLWADVKKPDGDWAEVPATTKVERATLLAAVKTHYARLAERG
jgi:hypothetical protein